MGFSGLDSFGSSDSASDLAYAADYALAGVLRSGLDYRGTKWNTPGPVNVALYLEERVCSARHSEELSDVIRQTISQLHVIASQWPEEKDRLMDLILHLWKIPLMEV